MLAGAAVLAGWPLPIKALAAVAVAGHGILRRPLAAPRLVLVTADGRCVVPEWGTDPRPLGARTLVCPFWIRLEVGAGPRRRDILLVADQVRPEAWRRLRALLMRTQGD